MKLGSSDGALKGRIIAIIVLTVVSAGSFVLGYLVGTNTGSQESPVSVEDTVKDETIVVEEPTGVTAPEEVVRAEPAVTAPPAAKTPESTAHVKRRAVKKSSAESFSVQAGVFGERTYAESFASKLRSKGYSAYIQDSIEEDGTVYKVKVGRFASREEAEAIVQKLKETEGIEGFVTGPG